MDIELATSQRDAEAAEAVRHHHAEMAGTLLARTQTLVDAAARGDGAAAEDARTALVDWCERDLVPHALAEEKAMYPAAQAQPSGRLLVEGMLAEHTVITDLVHRVAEAADPVRAAAAATALRVMFDSHLAKENDLVLPLLVETPGVSVADLLGGMHELLGGHDGHDHADHDHADHAGHAHHAGHSDAGPAAQGHGDGHTCGCGEKDPAGYPELDARAVPHAIRHATIFGALDAVPPSGGMILVAPHDPLPLIAQVQQRFPGAFEVSYLERGPEAWRLAFLRQAV